MGRIGRGQCAEHYGEEEPYLPVFEALWQLSRGPARDAILAVLQRYAPLWLVQLPGLVSEPELERLQRQVAGATPICARINCKAKQMRAYCMRSRFPLRPTGEISHAVAPDRSRYAL